MIVIPGPLSMELGEGIASKIGVQAYPVVYRKFPDGENYLRLTPLVKDETVIIVQTTFPDPDKSMIQLYLMIDAAKDLGAEKVVSVVPYLAYARQDRRFLDGEALSLDTIIDIIDHLGTEELVVVDIHNEKSLKRLIKKRDINIVSLSAMKELANFLKKEGFEEAYSLSPDAGAIHLAETAAEVLGGDSGFFQKSRDKKTGEIEMIIKDLYIEGKNAIVFDDIVSSGGTTALAVSGLKRQGAKKVAAACTHGLFMGNAEERITEAGADLIIATDSVQSHFSRVSIAGIIADHLIRSF